MEGSASSPSPAMPVASPTRLASARLAANPAGPMLGLVTSGKAPSRMNELPAVGSPATLATVLVTPV